MAICALVAPVKPVTAQVTDVTWNNTLSDWTLNGSWVGGIAPANDGFSNRVVFGNLATINAQPTLTTTASIAGLSFNNTGADWSLLGTGMLRIGTSGIAVSGSGTTSIAPNVRVARNQSWNVGSGSTLDAAGNLYGAATVTLTGAGAKVLSGTANMFHGSLVLGAGTLTINNPQSALRSASLSVQAGTTLAVSGGLRSGELSGGGTLSSGGEMRIYTLGDTLFTGTLNATNVVLFGAGKQTFNGATANQLVGVTGDVYLHHGTEVELAGNGTLTNAGNDVFLRGGTLTITHTGTANNRYLNSGASVSSTGGGRFSFFSDGGNQALALFDFGQGHVDVDVTSSSPDDVAQLSFAGQFRTGFTANFTGSHTLNSSKVLGANLQGAPRLLMTGFTATDYLGPQFTVDSANFARYNTANSLGVQAAVAHSFSSALSTSNAELTNSATYNSASAKSVMSLRISATGALDVAGAGGVATDGVLLTSNRTYTVRNSGGGTGSLTSGGGQYYHVFDGSRLFVETNVSVATSLFKAGEGTLVLTPRTSNVIPGMWINRGAVQTALGDLPSNTIVRLRGGVLEISGGGTLNKTLGTASGNVNWQDTSGAGSGGFSAVGAALTIDLEGSGASDLVWGQTRFVQNQYALLFGSKTSSADVVFLDNLALNSGNQVGYEMRMIDVDGSSSTSWKTVFSGVISSVVFGGSTNGQLTDLMKTGTGTLELTGNNTYVGGTIVAAGKLLVGHTNALGDASQSGAYVQVGDRGASNSSVDARLYLSANITFSRDIDVAEGAGARALGSIATGTATFAGNIHLNDLVTLRSESGAITRFTGVISGDQNVQTNGPGGIVVLSGANTYTGVTTIFGGTLQIDADVYSGSDGPIGRGTSALQLGPTSGAETATLLAGQAITFQRGVIAKTGTGATGTLTLGGSHTSGTADFTGPITLQRSAQLTSAVGGTTRFSGAMTGTGGITKIGDGVVRLDGTTTYTGATIVSAGTLVVGGSAAGAASTTVNGGTLKIVSGGTYDAVSSLTAAAGSSVVVDSGGTLSDSVTSAGTVTINGTLNGAATVQSGGTLGGSGRITGNISGAGLVSPGNSPGVLDASQFDPTSGADFLFQFTQANTVPNYLSRTDSGNDVLHLTHATTPFLASLTSANKITLDFGVSQLHLGDVFIGGFFTNQPGTDFYGDGTISAAQIEYLLNGTPLTLGPEAWQFQITTISQTGVDFGAGYGGVTDGRVMQVTVTQVPEPSSMLLCAAAAGGAAWRVRRQRRRPATTE